MDIQICIMTPCAAGGGRVVIKKKRPHDMGACNASKNSRFVLKLANNTFSYIAKRIGQTTTVKSSAQHDDLKGRA
jgi:hypothetical protein